MSRRHRLGDLQLAIMQVLWAMGEATSAQIHAALLADHGLAPTTIATMLQKMEAKGVVRHRKQGRSFHYRPSVREAEVRQTMVGELVGRLFGGDSLALVHHLLAEGDLDAQELAALRPLIEKARQEEEEDAES